MICFRQEVEAASQEKKKSRKEIRRHLKEKVVEKGETNREKLERIRQLCFFKICLVSIVILSYFHSQAC